MAKAQIHLLPAARNTVMVVDDQSTSRAILEQVVRTLDERVVVEGFEPGTGMARFDSAPPPAAMNARSQQQRRSQRNGQGPVNGARGGNGRNGDRPHGGQPRRSESQQRRGDGGRGRTGATMLGGNR